MELTSVFESLHTELGGASLGVLVEAEAQVCRDYLRVVTS